MRGPLARLLPRRIAAQTAMVVVVAVALVHLAITAQFTLLHRRDDDRRRDFVHPQTLVRLVEAAATADARARLIEDVARAYPALDLRWSAEAPPGAAGAPAAFPDRPGPPFDGLGRGLRVVDLDGAGRAMPFGPERPPPPPGGGPRRLAIGLADGGWLIFTDRPPPPPPFFFGPFGTSIVFAVLTSLLLGVWAARGLVGPLRALAAAARDFDFEREPQPLPHRGPEEIRIAAGAFEAMRWRIRSLVEDRTRMLAAMGHDLRTPITRLRLRSEYVTDGALRAEIQRDLAGMAAMIDGALTYLVEGRHREPPALVDLATTVQTICDGWADLGRDVAYEGPDHLVARLRPTAIERAFANLVDNALKYGRRCRVRLNTAGGEVVVEVEDDGPGIDEAERPAMLQPFVRGDAARNMDDHRGFGLGLAIVQAVVDGHRGRLEFASVEPHGLRVRVVLPATGQGREG